MDQVPGDLWQKFANLRMLYGYMWTHPGKKLLFMGSDFGQWKEWNYDESLEWHLLQWESLAERERKWNAFQADPEWHQKRAETEKNGPIVARVVNSFLQPTSFSAVK